MDFDLTPEEQEFREEVRSWLAENLPPPKERDPAFVIKWWKMMREKRWVGFNWPVDCGGGGGTVMQQFILKEEMLNAKAPPIGRDYTGLGWVGPAVIQFGTDEQKERFLPDILDSESAWCTGYSEPDVGSDLASLQCRAVRDGDEYVVNGQKIWISLAHVGSGIYTGVRTSTEGEKYDGISVLLIPLDSPGIEVRPIRSFAGDHFADLYNEVFFNDVRVPVGQPYWRRRVRAGRSSARHSKTSAPGSRRSIVTTRPSSGSSSSQARRRRPVSRRCRTTSCAAASQPGMRASRP